MKIGLQTWGTDGDIRPFVALSAGLRSAGHDVSLVVTSVHNKSYEQLAQEFDFQIVHAGTVKHDLKTEQTIHEKLRTTKIPINQIQIVMENFFDPVVPEMYEASKKLCTDNDLILGHFLMHPVMLAAEKSAKPYITVSLNHGGIPSKHTVPAGCINIGQFLNPFWWKFSNFVVDHALISSINELRQKENMPLIKNIMENVWISKKLNIISVSKILCKKQPDWPENHKICGFIDLPDQAETWEMPTDLKQFIKQGAKPVFITIGSMLDLDQSPAVITDILVKGALFAGCRAIVQSCWDKLPDFPDDPNIYKIRSVPHKHIFPHCSMVVHHGGAGTTQSATLYGCPSVVIEHFGDQALFAQELKRNGVALKVLHRRNVTSKKLAKAIKDVLVNPEMKKKAESLGDAMKKENGVDNAVHEIENYIETTFACDKN
jgi:sterol 3beta-glucosyltransferase